MLLGLDNAGKTKTVNGLIGDRLNSPVPTVGFSVINLKYYDYSIKIFDLGGGPNIRGIWHKYFADAHGIIFVVDSSDFSRFNEARMVLEDILSNDKIVKKPLLVLANKQDNENALDEIDIIEYLNIEQLVNKQKCPTLVQSCSATEKNSKLDPGTQKGYDWLLSNIIRNYDVLNVRVENDVREQTMKDREQIMEKMRKIKELKERERIKKSEDLIETYSDYVKKMEDLHELKLSVKNLETLDKDDSSNSSSISFPPICVSETCTLPDRPKSAVQIISHQLQYSSRSRKSSLKIKSNKTTPVNLYGTKLPHSAHEKRRNFLVENRNLKSADDSLFSKANQISNGVKHMGPSGDSNPKEIFQLNASTKLLPLKSKNSSTVPWVHNHVNGDVISVVNVD